MTIKLRFSPPDGGKIERDGESWMPELHYDAGEQVQIRVRPNHDYVFAGWSGDVPEGQENGIPITVTIKETSQEITAHFTHPDPQKPPLSVESDFDNGNAILRYIHQNYRRILVEPYQQNRSVNIWWHFKIHGIVPGEFISIETNHSPIAGDSTPVYSYDGVNWQRFNAQKAPFVQRFEQSSVEIARNIPYPYARSLVLASEMDGPCANVSNLAISEEGREIKMIRFTDPKVPDEQKKVIWVKARAHAFESHGSWFAEGFCRFMNSQDRIPLELLRKAIVYVVPMMDVDSVYHGGAGKSQWLPGNTPGDFSRDWGEKPHWNATIQSIQLLKQLAQKHEVFAVIDLHNPWYYEGPHMYLMLEAEEISRRFVALFQEAVNKLNKGNTWNEMRWDWKSPNNKGNYLYEPGRYGPSNRWMVENGIVDRVNGLVVVFETPHWKDDSGNYITKDGLLGFGEALGHALNEITKDR